MLFLKLRHGAVAVALTVALLGQGTWALAGTTGALSGNVLVTGTTEPIANARVHAVSPSQSAAVTTDANGHFVFLSLAPDTYTVSVEKEGYDDISQAGITVISDQNQTVTLYTRKTLKEIARVVSRAASELVRPGTTSDVYSVTSATAQKAAALGGGGNLNNAYSAIAAVPGAYVPQGQQGYGQALYIRGGDYNQVGYEFDGVPVNRSFDQYAGGGLSNLGQQELQVYTGGATASASASAISGFINQVIKTGTFPGFGTVDLGIGTPTYYHKSNFEAGGANPDRTFSYYGGIGGYNQDYRLFDQFDGSGANPQLGYASVLNYPFNTSATGIPTGVVPTCVAGSSGFGKTYFPEAAKDPGCYAYGPGFVAFGANVQSAAGPSSGGFFFAGGQDREAVANVHIAIPHKHDSGRDDVQLLWSASTLFTQFEVSQNDIGLQSQFNAFGPPPGHPECLSPTGKLICNSTLAYDDPLAFPLGTPFGVSPAGIPTVPYFQPSSPTQRQPNSLISPIARDGFANNQNIAKIQYQKNMSSNAYIRLYGYTFYSDWLINGPNFNGMLIPSVSNGAGVFGPTFAATPDYELSTHTRGAELQFVDQLNSKNLLNFTGNYTTATTIRANNTSLLAFAGSNARATNDTDGIHCFTSTGAIGVCNNAPTAGTYTNPEPFTPVNGTWIVTNNLPRATFNSVIPNFYSAALSDQFRPSAKWLINLGLRYELFRFGLSDTDNNGKNFWFNAGQHEFCYDPTTLEISFAASLACAPGLVHPDGLNGDLLLSNRYDHTVTNALFSPRIAGTYTFDPDTVLRFSYGQYAQPISSAFVQYNTTQPNLAKFIFQEFWKYGFTTPRHDVVPSVSENYDLSIEHHFPHTDVSIKVTPFLRSTRDQVQQFFLDPATGFVSGLNVGRQTSSGVEFQLSKGNFAANGFSGLLSYTFTYSTIKYTDFRSAPGRNVIDVLNDSIIGYNRLTSACASASASKTMCGSAAPIAAPCYTNTTTGTGAPDPACGPTSIRNPYFTDAPQPLFNRNGDYFPFDLFPAVAQASGLPANVTQSFLVPDVVTMILNYRHNKLALTPSIVFTTGNRYGVPLDTPGIDPQTCGGNSAAIPSAPSSLQADYTTCAGQVSVPNPENGGRFTNLGQYQNPSQLTLNFGVEYNLTPKITLNAVVANLYNRCFGGSSTPWTTAFPPGSAICAYGSNGFAPSPIATHGGFYNGSGPNDIVANGVALNPYIAHTYQPIGYNLPLEVFFGAQLKL